MDPIAETLYAFYQAIVANPIARGALFGLVRSGTGYIQKKWKEKTGSEFYPKVLGTTIVKYEVAVNALAVLIPAEYAGPVVVLADIIFSAAKKLKNGALPISP